MTNIKDQLASLKRENDAQRSHIGVVLDAFKNVKDTEEYPGPVVTVPLSLLYHVLREARDSERSSFNTYLRPVRHIWEQPVPVGSPLGRAADLAQDEDADHADALAEVVPEFHAALLDLLEEF